MDEKQTFRTNKYNEKKKYLATHTSYNIVNIQKKILSKRIAKKLNYSNLLKSCDIGLSTVILSKKILKFKNPFPSLKTKEDYVLWLKITKKGIIFHKIDKLLAKWTDTPNSLSQSIYQKLKDALKVYMEYEKMNFLKALYFTFILSINFLAKK